VEDLWQLISLHWHIIVQCPLFHGALSWNCNIFHRFQQMYNHMYSLW
jgi:hypothetical protein